MNARSKKFLSYYKPYLAWLLVDMVCAFMMSAITLILPLCIRHLTKNLLPSDSPSLLADIALIAAVMLALVMVHTLCNLFVDYQGHMMGAMMESDMRRELFAHYQKLSFSFFDEQKIGQLMSRITNDLFWLSEFYHHGPEDLAIGILKLGGVFLITLSINAELSLILLLSLPLMTAYGLHFNRKMNIALRESKERIGDINAQVEDTLAGIRVVQAFANEDIEQAKFERENARFIESRRHDYKSSAFFSGGMIAFTQVITILVIIVGGIGIVRNSLDLSDLITFLLYVGVLIEPIQRLVNFSRLYQEGITGFHRFMDMMELKPDIQSASSGIVLEQAAGGLELRHVSFRYRDDYACVLKNLSLDIQVGEYLALVGVSGIGKTTLSALIPRFYEVSGGQIRLDGIDIRTIDLHSLRRSIGVVDQDVYLFAATVADNIRYGKPDASQAEIQAAAKKANAHDFIMKLPQGYQTDIGQRGIKLSGGQKQRLSIARVFLKNPPIIILDEATSALDSESESAVQESLERLINNRTTLVIAHRLSTIRKADRILVLTEDGIGEQGTHDELIARGGFYASLYHRQPPPVSNAAD